MRRAEGFNLELELHPSGALTYDRLAIAQRRLEGPLLHRGDRFAVKYADRLRSCDLHIAHATVEPDGKAQLNPAPLATSQCLGRISRLHLA